MTFSAAAWLISALAAFAVGLSKGGLSMIGMLGVPLMATVMSPVMAAGILLPVYVISDIGGLLAFRHHWDRRALVTALPGAMLGVALGWATAARVDDRAVMLIVGLIGAGFAANAILRPRGGASAHRAGWGGGSFWGLIAGYTSFVSHSGAPPWQIHVQRLGLTPMVYAGSTTIFFAMVNAAKLLPYAMLDQLNPANLAVSAVLSVPAVLGVVIGLAVVRRVPASAFYGFITWALLLVSLRLIWSATIGASG